MYKKRAATSEHRTQNYALGKRGKLPLHQLRMQKICIRGCPYKTSAIREGRGLYSVDIFRTKGDFFRCGRPYFWCKRHIRIFRNLWCFYIDKGGGGIGPVRTFLDKGEGRSNFCVFVQKSFIEGS